MMGYRSAVEAVFYTREKEQYPLLKLYVDENFPKFWKDEDIDCLKPLIKEEVINAVTTQHHVGCYGYHFIADNVKWYESYSEIQEFNEFAEKFISFGKDTNWSYEFVRLGEEANDIEEERSDNADCILCVRREIEFNI